VSADDMTWRVVPVEPTEAMLVNGREALMPTYRLLTCGPLIGVWRDMLAASPVVPVGREDIEVVAEWLEMAKETPKQLHSSLHYVPVCASEIEAIERILAALRPTDTGRE